MTQFLVFRLYGPLCSWGEIAVGESRHSADHPSRSALLGLFAAALGIERGADEDHAALARAWQFGAKLLAPGLLLRDYHTVQAPRRQGKRRFHTRREELYGAGNVINTLLSTREYRTDSVIVVAAQVKAEAPWTLQSMQAALLRPRFPLYLGRKCCPPALPLAPQVLEVATLREALDSAQLPLAGLRHSPDRNVQWERAEVWPSAEDRRAFRMNAAGYSVRYFWEEGMHLDSEAEAANKLNLIEFVRNDEPLSRRRWQFGRRREWSYLAPAQTGQGGAA